MTTRFVVRENAWPFGSPLSVHVVRIIGLDKRGRSLFRSFFKDWVERKNLEAMVGEEPEVFYTPCWYEYKERPTWFDVRVEGMHTVAIIEEVRSILRMME